MGPGRTSRAPSSCLRLNLQMLALDITTRDGAAHTRDHDFMVGYIDSHLAPLAA